MLATSCAYVEGGQGTAVCSRRLIFSVAMMISASLGTCTQRGPRKSKLKVVKAKVVTALAAQRLVSVRLQCAIVICVTSRDPIRMLKTDCFKGEELPCM